MLTPNTLRYIKLFRNLFYLDSPNWNLGTTCWNPFHILWFFSFTTTHSVPQGDCYFIAHCPIWCLIATYVMLNFYITYDILTLCFISKLFPIIKNWYFWGYLVWWYCCFFLMCWNGNIFVCTVGNCVSIFVYDTHKYQGLKIKYKVL